MKKTVLIILITVISVMLYSCESNDNPVQQRQISGKAKNKVLIEFFTAVNCPNCPPPGYFLDNIDSLKGVSINDTNVIIIRYHSNYNGYDPFYVFNPSGSVARHLYYEYTWNPAGSLMGVNMPNFDQSVWTNLINQKLTTDPIIEVMLTNNYDTATRAGTLNISSKQISGDVISDLRLFAAVTENELYYTGTNGEKVHQNTYRDFLTSNNGDAISLSIGVLTNTIKNYNLKAGINPKNSHIVVFLQSQGGKTVFGVNRIKIF